jgi:hypothetical protein
VGAGGFKRQHHVAREVAAAGFQAGLLVVVGVFGDGTVPFAEGVYIGGYKAMIAGYPGASGSAMYTKNGVFGVLVAGYRGTHLIEFVPAWAVAQFLKE